MSHIETWVQEYSADDSLHVFEAGIMRYKDMLYYVTCRHAEEALDILADYYEQKGWEGAFFDEAEARQREDEGENLLRLGNHSRAIAEPSCVFVAKLPWEYLRTWYSEDGRFYIDLWDTTKNRGGRSILAYRFVDEEFGSDPIFFGVDFCCSPMNAIDSDETIRSLLTFLSLQKGDTDSEYFEGYTETQIQWRDSHAETLAMVAKFELGNHDEDEDEEEK